MVLNVNFKPCLNVYSGLIKDNTGCLITVYICILLLPQICLVSVVTNLTLMIVNDSLPLYWKYKDMVKVEDKLEIS